MINDINKIEENELITNEEVEKLLEDLQGIFKGIRIMNPERIPQAFRNLGKAYDELNL